jgi:ADP-heptose:LPS heptosyltransferase
VLPPHAPVAADAPITVQPGSRNATKEAPIALWRALLPALAERAPILLVGNADDRVRFAELRGLVPRARQTDLMGETDLPALIELTGACRAAVGVESLVAHLAVGHGRPTVVLSNPKASGIVAFPESLPSLTFVDMTHDPQHAAQLSLAHIDRCLA